MRRAVTVLALTALPASAQSLTVSGGLDVRASTGTEGTRGVLEGAFLNLRGVIPQDGADRWILVLQGDSGEKAEEPHLYQAYAQWKGPLGRWNLRGGRYLLPFGLLASHDSERLLLNTLEPLSLGLKLDEGLQLHGFTPRFDYAVSLSDGLRNQGPVASGRIGREGDEFAWGLSFLAGRLPEAASKESLELPGRVLESVPFVRKARLGFDGTATWGPDLLRTELVAGTDNGRSVGGAYGEWERALSPRWSLQANAGIWKGSETRRRVGVGAGWTWRTGRTLRAAWVHEQEREGRDNALWLQAYVEFSR